MANRGNKYKKKLNISLVGNQERLINEISEKLGHPPNVVLGMAIAAGLPQILRNIDKIPNHIA